MSDLNFDLSRALSLAVPNAKFFLSGNSWEGLEWKDERDIPAEQILIALLEADNARLAGRKIWETKTAFWDEFTTVEKRAIRTSDVPEIGDLAEELRMWVGQVWSDDARVVAGLSGLVAVGILTQERKQAILAP